MTRIVTERDHAQLKQFIEATRSRVAALEATLQIVQPLDQLREDSALAIPDATIEPATYADNVYTPGSGDASRAIYSTEINKKFTKAGATRGKITVLNLHRGMWLWSDVLIRVALDFRSGQWIADNLSTTHKVRGKASGSIAAGGTGSVSVYRGDSVERTVTGVKHDWITGAVGIANEDEVLMSWFDEDAAWRITGAECP